MYTNGELSLQLFAGWENYKLINMCRTIKILVSSCVGLRSMNPATAVNSHKSDRRATAIWMKYTYIRWVNSYSTLIKNKIKFSSYIRKVRVEQLQSQIWGRAFYYMRKCANISPYMRRPLVIYDVATDLFWIFLYMRENFIFFFISVGTHIKINIASFYVCHSTLFRLSLLSRWDFTVSEDWTQDCCKICIGDKPL